MQEGREVRVLVVVQLTKSGRGHTATLGGRMTVMNLVIGVDDPRRDDVRSLLQKHLAFAYEVTPAEGVFALDVDGLLEPTVTFVSARVDGDLRGVGALKAID